jgi:hypothetical protein
MLDSWLRINTPVIDRCDPVEYAPHSTNKMVCPCTTGTAAAVAGIGGVADMLRLMMRDVAVAAKDGERGGAVTTNAEEAAIVASASASASASAFGRRAMLLLLMVSKKSLTHSVRERDDE